MSAPTPSFPGSAFGAGPRRSPADTDACPCGAGRYGDCCGPILNGTPAPSALALMRSRYSAFALGHRRHLEDTWHPSTRPPRADPDDDVEWVSLSIDEVIGGEAGDRRGVVAFRARWRQGRSSGELVERSRFVFQHGRWWYVDGDVA